MAEDLLVLALDHLGLSSGTPFHVDVSVALVVSRGHPQGDVVVQVWLQSIQAHKQSWKQSPAGKQFCKDVKVRSLLVSLVHSLHLVEVGNWY